MKRAVTAVVAIVLAAAGLVAVWAAADPDGAKQVVLYDKESRYYRIYVVDHLDENLRCLYFSKMHGVQSSMKLDAPVDLTLAYSKSMMAAFALHEDPKEVLLLGLGGGSLPKFIQTHFPKVKLDIVELDPDVVKVAGQFFKLAPSPNTHIYVMDGRLFLKGTEKTYDIILLDAYAADHIPFHLTTLEFIRLARSRLKPGGLVASNLWEPRLNRFFFAEMRTFQAVFPQVYVMPASGSGNVIVYGSTAPEQVTPNQWVRRAERLARQRDFGYDMPATIGKEVQIWTHRVIQEAPLTDDMAPVNTLRHEHPKHFEAEAPGQS